jgi:hypothetical protein
MAERLLSLIVYLDSPSLGCPYPYLFLCPYGILIPDLKANATGVGVGALSATSGKPEPG